MKFDDSFVSWHNHRYQTYKLLTAVLLTLVFVVPPVVIFIGTTINHSGNTISGSTSQSGAVMLIALFGVLAVWRTLLMKRLKSSLWNEFAKIHGYKKSDDLWNVSEIAVGPVVADGAVARSCQFQITGENDGHKFKLSPATFAFDLFKTKFQPLKDISRYSFRYLILAVDIGTELPHIFIDGQKQNRFRYNATNMWSLNKRVQPHQRLIDLEGDFHKFFKVYIANVEHREAAAFSIVTPDVMLSMRDKGFNFDYEIYDKKLYVLAEDNIISIDKFMGFINAAEAVTNELVPQLAKQLHADGYEKLDINHKKAGWLAAWYSLGVFMSYAVLYFGMVGFCVLVGEIAADTL